MRVALAPLFIFVLSALVVANPVRILIFFVELFDDLTSLHRYPNKNILSGMAPTRSRFGGNVLSCQHSLFLSVRTLN